MKNVLTVVAVVAIVAALCVGVWVWQQSGQKADKKALDEERKETKKDAQRVIPMLYFLQELEKDPGAHAAQIQNLKNQFAEVFPILMTSVDKYGNYQIMPTDEAIEWLNGLIEEIEED